MILNLDTILSDTHFIVPLYVKKFQKLGINTIKDLIFYFPRRYNDFTNLTPIAGLSAGQTATVQGKILKIKSISIFRRHINITEAVVEDDSGSIKAIWFNQPYLAKMMPEGTFVSLSGKVEHYKKGIQLSNPMYEKIDEDQVLSLQTGDNSAELTHTGRLVPVYSETAGLTSRYIRQLVKKFLPVALQLPDILPEQIIKRYNFLPFFQSLEQIHFPSDKESLAAARKRLAFEELFIIQIASLKQKKVWQKQSANVIHFDEKLIQRFVGGLPFKLTNDQRKAAWDILRDIERNYPMNRLLIGDVGSGKTVVALIAAIQAASRGFETAFMAPTEILVMQHFSTAVKMLGKENLTIGLLTGSGAKAYSAGTGTIANISHRSMIGKINSGQIQILIGTHSLIQKEIKPKKLGLVIIDEQHRFGVRQRGQFLSGNKKNAIDGLFPENKGGEAIPHILSMSATPIPRTLALAFYGTVDISTIHEMPLNRKKITTKVVSPSDRAKAYNFIKQQIKKGRQAFIVCPLVEGTDANMSRAAVKEYNRLREHEFKEFKLGLLHGRLKPDVKDTVIKDFAAGKTNILVATSVVEVGIDIPNASVMMIEGAEHFGLAELHQFRGRVGRGDAQSYCFLFTETAGINAVERLGAMEKISSGFDLAAQDLKHRGPGEFLGIGAVQSGFPDLKVADLMDEKILRIAHSEAENLLADDFGLEKYPLLKKKLDEYKSKANDSDKEKNPD